MAKAPASICILATSNAGAFMPTMGSRPYSIATVSSAVVVALEITR